MVPRIAKFRALSRRSIRHLPSPSRAIISSLRFCASPVPAGVQAPRSLVRPLSGIAGYRSFNTSAARWADEPFKLADIGEGITEVEIISWTVKEGDAVEEFDTLCEVQSDKSTVELTAPFSGVVHHIGFKDGDNVKVGQVLCRIHTEGESDQEPVTNQNTTPTESAEVIGNSNKTETTSEEAVSQRVQQAEQLSEEAEMAADNDSAPTETPEAPQVPSTSSPGTSSHLETRQYVPIPPTEPDEYGQETVRQSSRGEVRIPPPPPRQIVRPVQIAHDKMSTMDRALIASLRAAADANDASNAAYHAAELLAAKDESMDASGSSKFSGEARMVRDEAPRREIRLDPVPARRERESEERRDIVKASPAVRTMAARLGVKLEDVQATGEGGRVTQQDIQNAVASSQAGSSGWSGSKASTSSSPAVPLQQQSAASHAAAPLATLTVSADRAKIPEITKVEFGRTRKVMYRAMGDMGHVPHFGYSHTLNLTPLLPYIKSLNRTASPASVTYQASDIPSALARDPVTSGAKQKTTLLSFLVKGLLLAMEEHPIMRARATEKATMRHLEIARDGVVGVAVSDPKYGLVTPSLPHLSPLTPLSTITSALSALRQNPTKPSPPANLTISSVGGLGEARDMMPVLPPGGGVAICAVGRAKWEVEWKRGLERPMDWIAEDVEAGGTKAVLRCNIGWSGDHRILEGAELIAFTETWKKYIEEPWRWISLD